jgi:DNA polymerase III delta' subunit
VKNRIDTIINGIVRSQRIAHAYLFLSGTPPAKLEVALRFARTLNCTGANPPCEDCSHCKKALKGIHPDLLIIEKASASIKIEQVRELKELTRYGPSEGRWQVVILSEADALTSEAANSFLKLLEEPPARVIFILISHREEGLPSTILSRCQKLIFPEGDLDIGKEARAHYQQLNARPFNFIRNTQSLSEAENLESILEGLFGLYAQDQRFRQARQVLNALKGIKRRANPKLAVDLLGVNLWKEN